MSIFVYYERNQNSEEASDVAAVKADSLKEAIKILKKHYVNVNKNNIYELTFRDFDGESTNFMIISDY